MYILRGLPQSLQADTSNPAMTPVFTPWLWTYIIEGTEICYLNTAERHLS